MTTTAIHAATAANADLSSPRMHHHSWTTADQEMTRAFYEDVLGLKLHSFWIEDVPYEGQAMVLSHAFYQLDDGSLLSFFNIADPKLRDFFKSPKTEMFNHFAFKIDAAAMTRLEAVLAQRDIPFIIREHGYCRSLYTTDPNGLRLEFAVDPADVDDINRMQERTAHATLAEWQAGRRTPNNTLRPPGGH